MSDHRQACYSASVENVIARGLRGDTLREDTPSPMTTLAAFFGSERQSLGGVTQRPRNWGSGNTASSRSCTIKARFPLIYHRDTTSTQDHTA